jgi:hypothetical protein
MKERTEILVKHIPEYNLMFFDSTGNGTSNFRLFSSDIEITEENTKTKYKNCLQFQGDVNRDGSVHTLYRFKVKIINSTGSIDRPGDDFLLRFGIIEVPDLVAKVNDGEFIAVYDHKLLWRANLSIDDRLRNNGVLLSPGSQGYKLTDWNDLHPWIEGNPWNTPPAGYNGVPGGQVLEICPWTNLSTNQVFYNTIPYGWGGLDTVSSFIEKMNAQKNAITAYYASGQNTTILPNPNPNDHRNWSPWPNTFAPPASGSQWFNYFITSDRIVNDTFTPYIVGNTTYYPYIPGFTSYRRWISDTYEASQINYSAGIDCSGFVVRSAAYDSNPYVLRNYTYNSTSKTSQRLTDQDNFSWNVNTVSITNLRCDGPDWGLYREFNSWEIDNNTDILTPGDILIYPGVHVVLVSGINHTAGGRKIVDKTKVSVIEATQGNANSWCIMNTHTWGFYGNNYKPRRLCIEK